MDAFLRASVHAAEFHVHAEGEAIRLIRLAVALLRRGPILILSQTTAINRGKQTPLLSLFIDSSLVWSDSVTFIYTEKIIQFYKMSLEHFLSN